MWWAPNRVTPRDGYVGYGWELVGQVSDGRRGKASTALLGGHDLGSIAVVCTGSIGKHWDTASRVTTAVGAGDGGVGHLVLGNEDVRGESGRGHSVR